MSCGSGFFLVAAASGLFQWLVLGNADIFFGSDHKPL
jgi:hypothetical protein